MNIRKLGVFISSSMATETGSKIEWKKIRRSLKKRLDRSGMFWTFALEDGSSSENPTEYYLKEITEMDLVVVLIGSVIRKGTYAEYEKAFNIGKPMLVYFDATCVDNDKVYGSNSQIKMSASSFKKEVELNNAGTYSEIDIVSLNPDEIYNDIMNNLFFRFKNYEQTSQVTKLLDLSQDPFGFGDTLKLFQSNHGNLSSIIFERKINITSKNKFGTDVIQWLVNGKKLPSTDDYLKLIMEENSLKKIRPVLKYRWKSLIKGAENNYELAIEFQKDALDALQRTDINLNWLEDDILVDCRNIWLELHDVEAANKYQDMISRNRVLIYPLLDRFKSELLESLEVEMQKYNLQSKGTRNFGSLLPTLLNKLEDYLFTAISFGSATYIQGARRLLADVLSSYGIKFDDSQMALLSVKLYFLNGNSNIAVKMLIKYWDLLAGQFYSQKDQIFGVFDLPDCIDRAFGKLEFVTHWGQQLSDINYRNSIRFIYELLDSNNDALPIISGVGQAINHFSGRLQPNELLDLVNLLLDSRFSSPIDRNFIPQILLSHEPNEYNSDKLNETLAKFINKVPNFQLKIMDVSLLIPLLRNFKALDSKLARTIRKSIVDNCSEMAIRFQNLLSGGKADPLKSYLKIVSESIQKKISDSLKHGRVTYGDNDDIQYLRSLVGFWKYSQKEVDKTAKVILALLATAFKSCNEVIIQSLLDILIDFLKQIFMQDKEIPQIVSQIAALNLQKGFQVHMMSAKEFEDNVDSALLTISRTIKADGNVWVDAFQNENIYAIQGCLLDILRAISRNKPISNAKVRIINSWLNNGTSQIIINVMPVALNLIFKRRKISLVNNIKNLSVSRYINVRISLLKNLKFLSEYNNTNEFREIKNAFKGDFDWRIRQFVSKL